jgi:hypothetical protein
VARLAEGDAAPVRLAAQAVGVGRDLGLVARRGRWREQVDPEGPPGQLTQRLEVAPYGIDALVAGGEKAEPARLAYRPGQCGSRRAAGHRGLDDGVLEL